jgi:hypothetical protein
MSPARAGRTIGQVLSALADLLRNRSGRGVSALTCAGLYALFAATLAGSAAFAIGRWGAPTRWPVLYRAVLVVVSIGGSFAWWWVNGAVEGRKLISLSHNHGLTTGDLLVVPALLFAVLLVALEVIPRAHASLKT